MYIPGGRIAYLPPTQEGACVRRLPSSIKWFLYIYSCIGCLVSVPLIILAVMYPKFKFNIIAIPVLVLCLLSPSWAICILLSRASAYNVEESTQLQA